MKRKYSNLFQLYLFYACGVLREACSLCIHDPQSVSEGFYGEGCYTSGASSHHWRSTMGFKIQATFLPNSSFISKTVSQNLADFRTDRSNFRGGKNSSILPSPETPEYSTMPSQTRLNLPLNFCRLLHNKAQKILSARSVGRALPKLEGDWVRRLPQVLPPISQN